MHKNKIIRQLLAFGLLLLFVFSNTPKQFVHDLFANHVDCKNGIAGDNNRAHVIQLNYHCQVDNLVVELPFIACTNINDTFLVPAYIAYRHSLYISNAVDFQLQSGLRGPPSLV